VPCVLQDVFTVTLAVCIGMNKRTDCVAAILHCESGRKEIEWFDLFSSAEFFGRVIGKLVVDVSDCEKKKKKNSCKMVG